MNKISGTRVGVDGVSRDISSICDFLVNSVESEIRDRLNAEISTLKAKDKYIATDIRDNLRKYLSSDVTELKKIADDYDKTYPNSFRTKRKSRWRQTKLGRVISAAFNYESYRKTVLVEIAKQLNVKTCPYCNMHYTLYANEPKKRTVEKLARFQFDHFFDKKRYPMLSMSFYNLIPSCGVCNQGKSTGQLALEYNPYYSEIGNLFRFRLKNPLDHYAASRINDEVEVSLVTETGVDKAEFEKFEKMFHLKALYGRHGDIVQEVFDKAYEDPYYMNPSNFTFLGDRAPMYLKRLWLGNYTEPEEIEKRPMAKFMQDMWLQAKGKI